jgi:acyl-CoA oxidase
MADTRYGRFRDDVDVFRTFEGDNTVLRLLVARNRLTDLSKQFNNASDAPKVSWPADKTDAAHLLDPAFQTDMVARRESDMLNGVLQKIATGAQAPGGAEKAIEKSQNDMIAYSDAYAEKLMLEQFIKAVGEQKDPETKAVLKDVCDVFAINTMLKHSTWYIENGYMSPAKTKALTALAEELNEKLLPNAVALVKAFAIPSALLAAPKVEATMQQKNKANGAKPG